jgi:ABC-type xylose transport system permease subunit
MRHKDDPLSVPSPLDGLSPGLSRSPSGCSWRTVVGVLFIALIGNGYILLGLDPLYEQIAMGVILLAAVALDSFARRTA